VANEGSEPTGPAERSPWTIPEALKRRLQTWIEVDELGPAGFWLWLEGMLPLLPTPASFAEDRAPRPELSETHLVELARTYAECARERARLTIAGAQYYADNQALARRVKALEAALAVHPTAPGPPAALAADREAERAAERYLPRHA